MLQTLWAALSTCSIFQWSHSLPEYLRSVTSSIEILRIIDSISEGIDAVLYYNFDLSLPPSDHFST